MTAEQRRIMPTRRSDAPIRSAHVIGLCGTAMGTLAAMLKQRGIRVTGSDKMAYPPMSTWLEAQGLDIQLGFDKAHIPDDVDLVVVGNVCRRDNPESVEAHERGLLCLSLPEVLRTLFFPQKRVFVVTGTHGKTTTSSMLAWIFEYAARDPSFFIGGITGNFGESFQLGSGNDFIIEGDEYDTAWFDKVPKFWHYPATHATINNIEYDHADIYPDMASIEHVFRRFAEQIPADGTLWVNADDPRALRCAASTPATIRTFGLGPDAWLRATDLRVTEDGMHMTMFADGQRIGDVQLPTQGEYNVRNYLGASGLAHAAGISWETIVAAAPGFKSTRRRQELMGQAQGITVYDDFAHHPTAVRQTIEALHQQYPDANIHVAFEAKSNTSRRAVFQDAYVEAFVGAASVTLAPPWKKDALPEAMKLSIPKLVDDLNARGVSTAAFDKTDDILSRCVTLAQKGDIIAVLSGSNFENLAEKIMHHLQEKEEK